MSNRTHRRTLFAALRELPHSTLQPNILKVLKGIYRKDIRTKYAFPTDTLQRRQELKSIIADYQENGMIGIVVDGTDCDHCRTVSTRDIPATVMGVVYRETLEYADAEGPTSVMVCTPSELPEPYQRDYLLEAFEDGHPHSVRY